MAGEFASAARGLDELCRLARDGSPRVAVHGCEGAFAACAIARVASVAPAGSGPLVVVVPDELRALPLARDIGVFLGGSPTDDPRVLHLPAVESSPYAEISPDRRALMR